MQFLGIQSSRGDKLASFDKVTFYLFSVPPRLRGDQYPQVLGNQS